MDQSKQDGFLRKTGFQQQEQKVIRAEDVAFSIQTPGTPAPDRLSVLRQILQQNQNNLYLNAEEFDSTNYTFRCKNQKVQNFGSCSYLGLEHHNKLKEGVIQATHQYGVQFSSAALFLSIDLYSELEMLYEQIFGYPVVLFSSTTLAHISALPIIAGPNDLVLVDQFAHKSLQFTTQHLKGTGIRTKTIPSQNSALVRSILEKYNSEYDKIWLCTDSIYSMHGDVAPLKELQEIQADFSNLYLYVDDAHGMSWAGENGSGYAKSVLGNLDRIVVVVSNSKCFAACGGTVILPNQDMKIAVKYFGPTMTFSGPIQPPMLGACKASAQIHLSNEIVELQSQLNRQILFRNEVIEALQLPVKFLSETPISFVTVGSNERTGKIHDKMLSDGFYANPALYPSVPLKENGIRFTTTLLQSESQIEAFCVALKHNLEQIRE